MSENWAVCIGINRYDNLRPLDYARQDAEAVSAFFRDTAGFRNVYFLAEDAPVIKSDYGQSLQSKPTFGNLMRFLRVRFEQPFMQPSDNLWFFFAGHGRRERDQDYLLPLDVDPGNVEENGIPVRYVAERLRRSGAENVILLLDACRNEGSRDGQGRGWVSTGKEAQLRFARAAPPSFPTKSVSWDMERSPMVCWKGCAFTGNRTAQPLSGWTAIFRPGFRRSADCTASPGRRLAPLRSHCRNGISSCCRPSHFRKIWSP
jgi:uncharacterized caspase-like protein